MSGLVWDAHECPSCGATVPMGLMSLWASCACGMLYVDVAEFRGWYFSWRHLRGDEEPIDPLEGPVL